MEVQTDEINIRNLNVPSDDEQMTPETKREIYSPPGNKVSMSLEFHLLTENLSSAISGIQQGETTSVIVLPRINDSLPQFVKAAQFEPGPALDSF